MLPPVMIKPGQSEATARVGDLLYVTTEAADTMATTVATDNSGVLEVSQATDNGSSQTAPGAEAIAAGVATLTITRPDGSTQDVAVTVS